MFFSSFSSMTMTAIQDPNAPKIIHNPKTQGRADLQQQELRKARQDAIDLSANVGKIGRYVKTAAHDHIITPNVPKTGQAFAFPRLQEMKNEMLRRNREQAVNAGVMDEKMAEALRLPPNTIAVVPRSMSERVQN
jgi:hypothetical protein